MGNKVGQLAHGFMQRKYILMDMLHLPPQMGGNYGITINFP